MLAARPLARIDECDQMMMPIRSFSIEWLTREPRFQALIHKMKLG